MENIISSQFNAGNRSISGDKVKFVMNLRFIFMTLFLMLIILFSRNFAHIKIGFMYITEAVIILTVIIFVFNSMIFKKGKFKLLPLTKYFLFLYIVTAISLVRGLYLYDDKVFVLRHSALFYYSIFYFIIPSIYNTVSKIDKLFYAIFLCCLVKTIVEFSGEYVMDIGANASYYNGFCVLMGLTYLLRYQHKVFRISTLIIILQFANITIAQSRAIWLGFLSALSFAFISFPSYLKKVLNFKWIFSTLLKIFLTISIILALFYPKLAVSIFDEFASMPLTILNADINKRSVNIFWRLYVWKDIINETMQKPVLGMGFGKKFIPPTIKKLGWGGSWIEEKFQDPHNSILSIFHRTGFIGLILFSVLIGKIIFRTLRNIKNIENIDIKLKMTGLLLCIIYILGTSLFMVILENPYNGMFLWISMGLIVSMERIYKNQSESTIST